MKHILFAILLAFTSPAFAQKLDIEALKNLKPRGIGPAGMSGRITAIDVVAEDPDIMFVEQLDISPFKDYEAIKIEN